MADSLLVEEVIMADTLLVDKAGLIMLLSATAACCEGFKLMWALLLLRLLVFNKACMLLLLLHGSK